MNLVVRNFKSIENLEVEIEESKVNFIVGLSGAGKTSLSQAITDDELLESRVRIGKSREDVERLCNGGPVDSTKFAVFDIEQVSMYKTSAIDGKETYKLLIRDDREIEVAKNEYNELVQNIRDRIDSVFELRDKISRLESSFGGKLTKSTKKLPKSAKILQVKEEIMSLQERHTYDGIFNLGIEGINWIAEGTKFPEFISESKCFFCEQIVPSERKLVVNDIARLTAKKLKPLFEGAGILTEFDIASPDFSNEEEVNAAVQEIEEIQLVNEDLTKILALCKVSDQLITNVDDFEQIVLKEKTKIFLPELTEIVDEINVQIETLKEKAEAINNEYNEKISVNKERIDNSLERIGIPYKIKPILADNTSQGIKYEFCHIDDHLERDQTNELSFGESNIVGLILFLSLNEEKVLLIDDPISSYDHLRRKLILDLIYELKDDRTVLILSHDNVFAKYAFIHSSSYGENTGAIHYFENKEGLVEMKPISGTDFSTLETKARKKIEENPDDYLRKILAIRLIMEARGKDQFPSEYTYLSKMIHFKTFENIQGWLERNEHEESDLLDSIAEKLNLNREFLSCVEDDYIEEGKLSMRSWTNFEKIAFMRDSRELGGFLTTSCRTEINSYVHHNHTLIKDLDPYSFDLFTAQVHRAIREFDTSLDR